MTTTPAVTQINLARMKRYQNELIERIDLQAAHAPRLHATLLHVLREALSGLGSDSPLLARLATEGDEGLYAFEESISNVGVSGGAAFIGRLIDAIALEDWDEWVHSLPQGGER